MSVQGLLARRKWCGCWKMLSVNRSNRHTCCSRHSMPCSRVCSVCRAGTSWALSRFPQLNAHYDVKREVITRYEAVHLGVAAPVEGHEVGRDVLSRVIYSTRPAISAGLVTVVLAAIVGALTGLVAGYRAGVFDALIMRLLDTLLAFPAIFLAIGIVTVLGPGWINAILAIAILNMPVFSRLVRASTLAVRNRDAFRSFVLSFLEHAEVLEPDELRADLVDWLEALAR